jgi:hypothetical protein
VRADEHARAREVGEMLEELYPAVQAWLPGAKPGEVEVWVQKTPALYTVGQHAYREADGFWAEGAGRIHLRDDADSLRRTLAHELVHAALAEEWRTLPGTLEEGLCDLASARLCPESAVRMRAGRLSSAGFVIGGLKLDLEVSVPAAVHALGVGVHFSARLKLEGESGERVDPLGVFGEHAGLSSSRLASDRTKAYYGLAFLVLERIEARGGIEELYRLCERTHADRQRKVPVELLLEAAGLDRDPATWTRAIAEALGTEELAELAHMHPGFLVEALSQLLAPCLAENGLSQNDFDALGARMTIAGTTTVVDLLAVEAVREGLWRRLRPERLTETFAGILAGQ